MADRIYGHDAYKPMTCPHCTKNIEAELIEIKLFTSIYKCPKCDREIHKKTIMGYVAAFWTLGLPDK